MGARIGHGPAAACGSGGAYLLAISRAPAATAAAKVLTWV